MSQVVSPKPRDMPPGKTYLGQLDPQPLVVQSVVGFMGTPSTIAGHSPWIFGSEVSRMGEACVVISPEYDRVIHRALISQLIIGGLAALTLDGGIVARVVGVAVLGFWLCAAFVVMRRRFQPSKIDLTFIKWGFWPVLVVAFLRQALA